jgi:formamidopyrimidine-DNA glycosylase
MGPEPLTLSTKEFLELLENYPEKNIKGFLLNQRNIAGIGNVYSDEMLFQAKINPHRNIKTLTTIEKQKLFSNMREVLQTATNFTYLKRKPPQSWILFNRGPGAQCPENKNHRLKREIIAGRPAIFCQICQR